MKKYILTVLCVMVCLFCIIGCSSKDITETVSSAADYPASIMVDDKIYLLGQAIPAEIDESSIIGYTTSYTDSFPSKNGETNFNRKLNMPYAEVEGGIAVLYENEWYLCNPMEEEARAPLAPTKTDKDLINVSYIEIMSGLTGQRIKVKESDSVQKVMNDIKSLTYVKESSVEEVGYAYRIRFYNENDDELGRIFITEQNGHQISYDGYYYLIEADQNINVNYLEELLKNAPPAEPGDEGNDELPDIEPEETILYNGIEYKTSELCDATLHWLSLSEQERMFSSYLPPEFMIFEETCGITLTAENITPEGLTIKCTQSAGGATGELQTGSWYIVENWTKENGWKEMPYVIEGVGWTSEAWIIPMNDTCEWEVNWEWLYGSLPAGKYRIGKQIDDFRDSGNYDTSIYHVEFEITE